MAEVTRKPDVAVSADLTGPKIQEPHCLNCGRALTGAFCANCGQRAIPAYPTVSELASDAFHEVSGWDGRFASTFRTLIRKPGELTREFLIGHRRRYISPIRLYLVTSVVYFIAAAAAPDGNRTTVDVGGGVRVGIFTPRDTASQPARTEEVALTPAQLDSVPALFRPIVQRSLDDPAGVRRSILATLPRALFALLPVFAGILAIFYRGRHYPEHLYFALHLHSFIFLALTVSATAKMSQLPLLIIPAQLFVVIAIPVYATKALRRVYGGSLAGTLGKGVGIATLYSIASVPVWIALLVWAALR